MRGIKTLSLVSPVIGHADKEMTLGAAALWRRATEAPGAARPRTQTRAKLVGGCISARKASMSLHANAEIHCRSCIIDAERRQGVRYLDGATNCKVRSSIGSTVIDLAVIASI